MDVVRIPGGEIVMGSPMEEVERCVREWIDRLIDPAYAPAFRRWILKEYPAHRVCLRPFLMARFPVCNGEYRAYLADRGGRSPESLTRALPDDHPVWGVRFEEALAYIDWLRERDGRAFRLPTEAEWECAAAGPDRRRYPYGDTFDPSRCNTVHSGRGTTSAVDDYPEGASGHGVWDMAGNVEEWTSSRYSPYPGGVFIEDDLTRLVAPGYPILRGGSFALGGDLTRCARRHGPHPAPLFRVIGFRLACDDDQASR
jgi:formylglycine-generating enzyme required for sulfatase activity